MTTRHASTMGEGGAGPNRLRWWIGALDAVTILAMAAALATFVAPGRYEIGPVAVSLRTLWRPLVLGAAAYLLRRALQREPTLSGRVAAWSHALRQLCPVSVRVSIGPFLLSRLTVLFVAYLAVLVLRYGVPWPPFHRMSAFQQLPLKWDAAYYADIARDGYAWSGDPLQQQELAFFPAYPVISRAAGWLFGGVDAGLFIVALGSFFLALTYFYKLAREDIDANQAETAVLFLAFYPFAAYFSADYTEALFLLAAVAAFYHFRRCEWWRAAAFGALLGLTRPNGCLLSVALGAAALERAWSAYRGGFGPPERRRFAASALVASAPIAAMAAHSMRVYAITGDPLTWLKLQRAWGREYHSPAVLLHWFTDVVGQGFYQYATANPLAALQSLAVLLAAVAVWPVIRRFGVGYGVFILVNLIPPIVNGGMMSMGRFTSTLFPMFLWLGVVVPAERRTPWIAACAIVQGFVATMFFTYHGLA